MLLTDRKSNGEKAEPGSWAAFSSVSPRELVLVGGPGGLRGAQKEPEGGDAGGGADGADDEADGDGDGDKRWGRWRG